MTLKTVSNEDFWLKIKMKDYIWEALSKKELDKLDEFERKLNEVVYERFMDFIKYDSTVIIL